MGTANELLKTATDLLTHATDLWRSAQEIADTGSDRKRDAILLAEVVAQVRGWSETLQLVALEVGRGHQPPG
jgi:hypothetical protein